MIRNATEDDVLELLAIGRAMHQETTYSRFDYSDEKVAQMLLTLIEVDAGIALVAEQDGEIHGGFIGAVHPHWFGEDLHATDYALFLKPEHRKGTVAARLIKEYAKQAKEKGAKQVLIGTTVGYQPEQVSKLFEACGFKRIGFIHEETP